MCRAAFSLRTILPSTLIAILVVVLMIPSNPYDRLPGMDNGVFLYGGKQLLSGKVPYLDFWDHKGPLIFVINAIGLSLADGSRWGVWLLELVFMYVTALCLFLTGRRLWGETLSLTALGGWGWGVFILGPYHHFQDHNYTESYSVFFGAIAVLVWVASKRQIKSTRLFYFVIGLLGGLSFLLRPNTFSIYAGIVVTELILSIGRSTIKDTARHILFVFLGFLTVCALFSAYFISHQALSPFFDAVFTYNFIYSQQERVFGFVALLSKVLPLVWYFPILTFSLLALHFLIEKFLQIRARKNYSTFSSRDYFPIFLLISFPLEAFSTSISGRFLLHYFITWTPFFFWLTGTCLYLFLGGAAVRFENKTGNLALVLATVVLVIFSLPSLRHAGTVFNVLVNERTDGIEKQSKLIEYIKENTKKNDKILVWGNDVWINFLAERDSPSKYIYQYPLFMPVYSNEAMVGKFLEELKSAQPALIVEPVIDTNSIYPISKGRVARSQGTMPFPAGMEDVYEYIYQKYCVVEEIGDVLIYRPKEGCE